jgi:uncharacterized protein
MRFGIFYEHQLERPGSAARVWQATQHRSDSRVLGPHFEQVCREWTLNHAEPDLVGGLAAKAANGRRHVDRLAAIRELIRATLYQRT